MDCKLGIQVELPTSTKPCTSLLDAFLSQAPCPMSIETLNGAFQGTWPAPPYSPANAGGGVPLGFVMVALYWTRFQHRTLCLLHHVIISARDRRPFSIMMI